VARAPQPETERPPHDALEGVPNPREQQLLVGHRAAEQTLLGAYRSGRMHHGWIIAGERGIGKATLAFRLARFVFTHSEPDAPELARATDLAVAPDHPAARRLAAGVHPNLLHLQRDWMERDKRFRTELSVDSVRRITPFLGTTAGEGGWRVIIVDPADDLSVSAANAILKNLEEPPRRTLFLLLARTRGALLPTILSRCRTLRLAPLAPEETEAVLRAVAPDISERRDEVTAALAGGSPRRLIELRRSDAAALYRTMRSALEEGSAEAQHQLAIQSADAAVMRQLLELFEDYLARRVRGQPEPDGRPANLAAPLVTWAELWEKAALSGQEVETYNLDRRQFVLELLESSAAALRQPGNPR